MAPWTERCASSHEAQGLASGTLSNVRDWPDSRLHSGQRMFFFFSNRLGCLGSLLISGLVTVALLFLLGIVRF